MSMKKVIVPIIIAAALGVGGGITAVMLNGASNAEAGVIDEDNAPLNVEVKSGKYYLGGDKNSDLWIEVNPDFLILKGDDVDASIRNAIVERATQNEAIEEEISNAKILYCTEKVYGVRRFGTATTPYMIKVSRDNTESDPEKLMNSNAGFPYDPDTNTIRLSLFGDFTLVE